MGNLAAAGLTTLSAMSMLELHHHHHLVATIDVMAWYGLVRFWPAVCLSRAHGWPICLLTVRSHQTRWRAMADGPANVRPIRLCEVAIQCWRRVPQVGFCTLLCCTALHGHYSAF